MTEKINFAVNNYEYRNQGIGGSDAGVVLGVNPYKTPLSLYLEKTGQISPS